MEEQVIQVLTRQRVVVGQDNKSVRVLKGKVLLNDVVLFEVDSDKEYILLIEAQDKLLQFSSKLTVALKNTGLKVKTIRQEY
jgi:hypothetical protein